MSHSSDSYEVDTPTDYSDSDMEIVEDEDVIDALFREKDNEEQELRERLARKLAEKALFTKIKNDVSEGSSFMVACGQDIEETHQNGNIEDGEILSDNELHISNIPLPPSPQPINISDDEDYVGSSMVVEQLFPPPRKFLYISAFNFLPSFSTSSFTIAANHT